ncbi:MAG: hypothetical protein LBR55_02350 [Bacteroidales bacterium]|jgi:hypothetical protein|nr:hypothetical protein [Bacteroidales bacterium]
MKKQTLFIIIVTLGFSCSFNKQENQTEQNIYFDFTAQRIDTYWITIKASLFNDNADTVYFLSATCDGEQYSLQYDTAKFALTPFISCNASCPQIIKIAPKGQHDFEARFRSSSKETKIKLGFDFYSVDKTFDLTNNI